MGAMEISEIAVWSAMLGGLLTITALALADALFSRNAGSVRNLLFVLITGSSCVVMTGLPEAFFPGLPERLLMLLKAGLGPLAGAIALVYLGIWLGGMREDVVVYRLTAWGGAVLFFATMGLVLVAAVVQPQDFRRLLLLTATVNMAAVVLAIIATARATLLGDPLARWMVLACVLLAAMVAGLYLRGLNVPGVGLGSWIVTATVTVAYYLLVSVLILVRNRQQRQLTRLARLQLGADPATGLPTGSTLLSEVEHAFWRTARMHGQCTVVCLHLRNLYELGQAAGRGVEHQIQVAMAARIRRAAGFRCIVGLYHPRCFVVVISADKRREYVNTTVTRLRQLVAQPLSVVGANQARHDFMPQLGVGVVTLDPSDAKPLEVINEAERQALGTSTSGRTRPAPLSQDHIPTGW
jgi:GGDEF domain-containing protein